MKSNNLRASPLYENCLSALENVTVVGYGSEETVSNFIDELY